MTSPRTLVIGDDDITLDGIIGVAIHGWAVELADKALGRAAKAAQFIREQAEAGRRIYGVTTGFGANSGRVIDPSETETLQANLLKSHACGVGEPFPRSVVRAMMCLRARALLTEHSGARPATIKVLVALLNAELIPDVPSQGSVGASGDLCPLAHMTLPLIGLGHVVDHAGARVSGAEALKRIGSEPVRLSYKEGLALLNGTQVQTALGVLAIARARLLMEAADAAAALSSEALCGRIDAYDARIHTLRRHQGQIDCAANLRWWLAESALAGVDPDELGDLKRDRVQDPYCLRCVPQVHGAARGVLDHVESVVGNELNAVTDNPVLFPEDGAILSGGNFHGEPIALALDYLKLALCELANISDRRAFKLLSPDLNEGLPAFLVENPGLDSGLMIAQYVSAALVSENKGLAHPASVDSVPTSANKEDHVAMGVQAGSHLLRIAANSERVVAIELLIAAQALEMRIRASNRQPSPRTRALLDAIRHHVAFVDGDRVLSDEIETLAKAVVRDPEGPIAAIKRSDQS